MGEVDAVAAEAADEVMGIGMILEDGHHWYRTEHR